MDCVGPVHHRGHGNLAIQGIHLRRMFVELSAQSFIRPCRALEIFGQISLVLTPRRPPPSSSAGARLARRYLHCNVLCRCRGAWEASIPLSVCLLPLCL
jgi:hypothetical protein